MMRKLFVFGFTLLFAVAVLFGIAHEAVQGKTTFITIGTGGITGVYYPTGGAIARIVNKKRELYGIRCTVESTGGSVFNVNAVMTGDLDFGIVQSDRQYKQFEVKRNGKRKVLKTTCERYSASILNRSPW